MMQQDAISALRLAFSDRGARGPDAPVLFVHGFGHHRAVWHATRAALDSRWRTIAVDLRGHGESPWSPTCAYDVDDYASDLPRILDELEISTAHVVAHSLGGQVALVFAANHPDRVRSLTLVDTGPTLRSDASQHVVTETDEAFRSFPSVDAYRRVLTQLHPFAEAALLDEMARASLRRRIDGRFETALDPGVLGGSRGAATLDDPHAARIAREERLWESYREVNVPVLVTRGRLSSILDEGIARKMTDGAFESRRLVQFEGAGHAIMIDASRDFSTELREFLESIDTPDGPRTRPETLTA